MNQRKAPTKEFELLDHYRDKGLFRKSDIITATIIIALIIVSVVFISNREQGASVEIYYAGELKRAYSLNQDRTITIAEKGYNEIVIKDGEVYMRKADCENQICAKTPSIKYTGQRIVCAPNGIVIIIRGKSELDGITGGANAS